MNRLIFGILLGLIAIVSAQYQPPFQNRPQYQPQYQAPPQPYGANYDNRENLNRGLGGNNNYYTAGEIDTRERFDINGNRVRYTRICDERGCYDRRSGSSVLSINFMLVTVCAAIAAVKMLLH